MITPQIIPVHDGEKPALLEQWHLADANVMFFQACFCLHIDKNRTTTKKAHAGKNKPP